MLRAARPIAALALALVVAAMPQLAGTARAVEETPLVANTRDAASRQSLAREGFAALFKTHENISVIVTLDQDTSLAPQAASRAYASQKARLFAAQDRAKARIQPGSPRLDPGDRFEIAPMFVMSVTRLQLERLLADPEVVSVEYNRPARLKTRLDEMRDITNVEDLWPAGVADKGNGETLVIIDEGADSDLPAIKGRVLEEHCVSATKLCYDPVADKLNALKTSAGKYAVWNCRDTPQEIHDRSAYCTSHGTKVASVAAGRAIPGLTYSGFGSKLGIVFVRLAFGDSSLASFAKAIETAYIAGKAKGAKVITTSIGWTDLRSTTVCDGASPAFDTVFSQIVADGMVITNSAGNDESSTTIDFPGCHSKVLSIGASTESSDAIAKLSDVNRQVDFLSPGNSVVLGPFEKPTAGTSYSTPSVAATLALLHRAFPAKAMKDIVTALRCGGKYLNRPGSDTSIPRINARAAMAQLSKPKLEQNFEFDSANALKNWAVGNGTWQIRSGRAVYQPVVRFTNSAIYTDLCLDDFVAEASIKATTTVFQTFAPDVSAELLLNYSTKGDVAKAGTNPMTGYMVSLRRHLTLTYSWFSVDAIKPLYLMSNAVSAGPTSRLSVCSVSGLPDDPRDGVIFRIEKSGRKLKVFVNNVLRCTVTVDNDRFRSIGVLGSASIFNGSGPPGEHRTDVDYLRVTDK